MTALVLMMAMSLHAGDTLVKREVGALTLKLPKEWASKDAGDGNGQGRALDGGDGQLELNVYPVDPRRDAKLCLEQLLKALNTEGYEPISIGGQPAARKVTTDFVGEGEAARTEANKVSSVSLVGCDGSTKWVMTMTSNSSKAARFGPLLKRITESVAYAREREKK